MTTELAKRLYNSAESAVKAQFPNLPYYHRAEMINDELDNRFGLDMSDEIIDLVFESELS